MTEKVLRMSNMSKPLPMKLFAAWEVDRTPPNCVPRLCSLTITRLSLLTPLPADLSSLSLAVKMQSSKRTLRSHEIPVPLSALQPSDRSGGGGGVGGGGTSGALGSGTYTAAGGSSSLGGGGAGGGGVAGGGGANPMQAGTGTNSAHSQSTHGAGATLTATSSCGAFGSLGTASGGGGAGGIDGGAGGGGGGGAVGGAGAASGGCGTPQQQILLETDLDLHFSLQYPHFIKRDGNRLQIILQRRKKYKTRTILGYKTLAEGVIKMDAVLQKTMDMTVELTTTGKGGRPGGVTVATLRAERVSSVPVDQDNKNNNSMLADRGNEYSDEDEENEFSSTEDNYDGTDPDYSSVAKRERDRRKYLKLERRDADDVGGSGGVGGGIVGGGSGGRSAVGSGAGGGGVGVNPVDSDSEFENLKEKGSRAKISRTLMFQQRNFKQKIVSLLKRFKVPDELESGGVGRSAAALRGGRELDALFQELESLSCGEGDDSGPDLDSLSVGSTPKPSLRPFFTNSRSILQENMLDAGCVDAGGGKQVASGGANLGPSSAAVSLDRPHALSLTLGPAADKGSDWRNDSSGNENNQHTDPEALNSDSPGAGGGGGLGGGHLYATSSAPNHSTSGGGGGGGGANNSGGSPPRDKDGRHKLFRVASSTPSSAPANTASAGGNAGKQKQRQTLSLSAEPPAKCLLDTCLSPTNVEPRKSLLDQLSRTFATEEAMLPDVLTIVGPPEPQSGYLTQRLAGLFSGSFRPTFVPHNTAEVKAVMQALMNKIHKYCNTTAKPPTTVKVLLLGGDWLEGAVLRHYVDLLGVRPPDWVNHIRFYIVPVGSSTVSRYLCALDSSYGSMFGVDSWLQHCERAATLDAIQGKADTLELTNRIQRYLHTAGPCTQIPIAEAMVNYKDEDSCQIFVPFISDVKIACVEQPPAAVLVTAIATATSSTGTGHHSLDHEDSLSAGGGRSEQGGQHPHLQQTSSGTALSSSPPNGGRSSPPQQQMPGTPQQLKEQQQQQQHRDQQLVVAEQQPLELQLDYWPIVRPGDKTPMKMQTEQSKNSIKSAFRSLQVYRLPLYPQAGDVTHGLIINYSTKEKKQKIMRLGKKKEKDREPEKQCIDGIARLICSPKQSHPIPLRVYIDGTEWTGVKFFQLSSQWQTHVKNFPVALIGTTNVSADMC